jgi:hypothetical protein
MSPTRSIFKHIAVATLIALVLFGADTLLRQATQYRKAEAALATGNTMVAITAYESAIRMYIPGSPLVTKSAERLWSLAEQYETARDIEKAIVTYRALRSSFYAVHSLFTPGMDWIARCDQKIAVLAPQRAATDSTQLRN